MSRVFSFLRSAFLASLLLVPALTATSSEAKAGTLDGVKGCFLAAEAAAEIAQLATDPQFLACGTQLTSGDPMLIALTVVMGALAASGNINSADTCKALVYGSAANFISDALVAAGVVSAQDGQTIKNAAQDGSYQLIQGILQGIGIGQQVDCACLIAGNAVESVKLMVALAQHGKECAGMAKEVAAALVNGVASGIYGVGEWVQGLGGDMPAPCTTATGGYIVESGYPQACVPGKFETQGFIWLYKSGLPETVTPYGTYAGFPPVVDDGCGMPDWSKLPKNTTPQDYPGDSFAKTPNTLCFCPPGTKLEYGPGGPGTKDKPGSGYCACPKGLGYTAKGTCEACPDGQVLGAYSKCEGCPKGTLFDPATKKCAPLCPSGQIMEHPDQFYSIISMNCSVCPAGSRPTYKTKGSSVGKCEMCPPGTTSQPGDLYCANKCSPLGEWVGGYNGKCVDYCPKGQFASWSGGEFPTKICNSCPEPKILDVTGNKISCVACPAGTQWHKGDGFAPGGSCSCPQGQSLENGKCQVCQGVVAYTSTGGTCLPCPAGSTWKTVNGQGFCEAKRPPKDCGPDAVPDKNNPYTQCVACPKGFRALGFLCVPKNITRITIPPGTKAPTAQDVEKTFQNLKCPPFMKNIGGMCVPDPSNRGGDEKPLPAQEDSLDCKKLGSNYIKDAAKPGACKKCPMNRIANAAGTACILGFSSAPIAPGGPNISMPDTQLPREAIPAQVPPGAAQERGGSTPPPPSGNTGNPALPQQQTPPNRTYTPPPATGGYTGQSSVPSQPPANPYKP